MAHPVEHAAKKHSVVSPGDRDYFQFSLSRHASRSARMISGSIRHHDAYMRMSDESIRYQSLRCFAEDFICNPNPLILLAGAKRSTIFLWQRNHQPERAPTGYGKNTNQIARQIAFGNNRRGFK